MKNYMKIVLVFTVCVLTLIGCANIAADQKAGNQPTIEQLKSVQDNLWEHKEELKIDGLYTDEFKNVIVVQHLVDNVDFDETVVIDFVGNPDILAFEEVLSMEDN